MSDEVTRDVINKNLRETFLSGVDSCIELLKHRNMPGAVEVCEQFKIRMLKTWRQKDASANGR